MMVVYTVLTNNYDVLQPALFPGKARYICFSDNPVEAEGWEYRHFARWFEDARRDSRWPKIRPDRFLPGFQVSLYHDANYQLQVDPVALCEKWLRGANLALFGHPFRDCLYDEVAVCRSFKLDTAASFDRQTERYLALDMPDHWGLFAGMILLRRHLEPDVVKLSELWWSEYSMGSNRDQVSLAYSMWKTGIDYNVIPGDPYNVSQFTYQSHGRQDGPFLSGA